MHFLLINEIFIDEIQFANHLSGNEEMIMPLGTTQDATIMNKSIECGAWKKLRTPYPHEWPNRSRHQHSVPFIYIPIDLLGLSESRTKQRFAACV